MSRRQSEKFVSADINLSPNPIYKDEVQTILKHPGLDNHGMGTICDADSHPQYPI